MILDRHIGGKSNNSQISGFGPGALLWRAARTAGTQAAFVTPANVISYRDFSEQMLCAAETDAHTFERGVGGSDLGAVMHICGLFAAGLPGQLVGSSNEAACGGQSGQFNRHDGRLSQLGWTIDAPAFDSLALFRKLSESEGIGWDAQALCFGWGVAAPAPGTVSVITADVGAIQNWSALFGVLLGRGKVVIPESFGGADWLNTLSTEGVTQVNLEVEQLLSVLKLPVHAVPSVRHVRVWHTGMVAAVQMRALKSYFPNAILSRVLHWAGGPLAVATLDDMEKFGPHYLGSQPLGIQCLLSAHGEILVDEGAYSPRRIFAADQWKFLKGPFRNTGLNANRREDVPGLFLPEGTS